MCLCFHVKLHWNKDSLVLSECLSHLVLLPQFPGGLSETTKSQECAVLMLSCVSCI
jgi:hypothetical protein